MRTSAEGTVGLPARSSRDARRWIERQLRWERTLQALRTQRGAASDATREVRTAA